MFPPVRTFAGFCNGNKVFLRIIFDLSMQASPLSARLTQRHELLAHRRPPPPLSGRARYALVAASEERRDARLAAPQELAVSQEQRECGESTSWPSEISRASSRNSHRATGRLRFRGWSLDEDLGDLKGGTRD